MPITPSYCSAAGSKPSFLETLSTPFLSPIKGSLINSRLGTSLPCDWAMFSVFLRLWLTLPNPLVHTHTHTLQFLWELPSSAQITFKDLKPDWFHEPYNAFPSWTSQMWTVRFNPCMCVCVCVYQISCMSVSADSHTLTLAADEVWSTFCRRVSQPPPPNNDVWPLHNITRYNKTYAVVHSIVLHCCHANITEGGRVGGETDLLDWNDSQITKSHSFGL